MDEWIDGKMTITSFPQFSLSLTAGLVIVILSIRNYLDQLIPVVDVSNKGERGTLM